MGKIIFVIGGARSGKSTYALGLANKFKRVAFIATCQGLDKEMRQRIALHKQSRPKHWETFEEPRDVSKVLKRKEFDCVIIDCLTLLISNLLLSGDSISLIESKAKEVIALLKRAKGKAIVISNEVGMGIVPKNKLSREFRDIAGIVNQAFARASDETIFMLSGIPMKLKEKRNA